jgi:predicted transcriptional regulator
VTQIAGDMVTIDGNHPARGQNLNFDVEIAEVRGRDRGRAGARPRARAGRAPRPLVPRRLRIALAQRFALTWAKRWRAWTCYASDTCWPFKPKSVWTVGPETPVLEAIRMMADKHIGALPVMRGEELMGIVSERDYARKVILMGRSSSDTPVWEIMSSPVTTVTPDESVHRCMEIMTEKRIRHLPVVERGRMIGIISIGDLVKAVIEEQQQTIDQLERYIAG